MLFLSIKFVLGVCVQQSFVHPGDSQIAGEALQLLVTCLQLRSNNISLFYNLPLVSDFVIDTVLGSPSENVRTRACAEFQRLSRIRYSGYESRNNTLTYLFWRYHS